MQLTTTAASVGSDLHRRVRWNKVYLFLFFSTHHAFVIYSVTCFHPNAACTWFCPVSRSKLANVFFFSLFSFLHAKTCIFHCPWCSLTFQNTWKLFSAIRTFHVLQLPIYIYIHRTPTTVKVVEGSLVPPSQSMKKPVGRLMAACSKRLITWIITLTEKKKKGCLQGEQGCPCCNSKETAL